MRIENLTTLIYITRGDKCLFIRKTRKGDMNLDKYLGIGGHFESDETAEECVIRELSEESAIDKSSLEDFRYRGLVTFISNEYPTEYMHVFSASVPGVPLKPRGTLRVPLSEINDLPIWEGDKIMFDYLFGEHKDSGFFTMKFCYEGSRLAHHEEKSW